jgi:hypothetical protein
MKKNMWSIDSVIVQKAQEVSPDHPRLIRLSLVRILLCKTIHKKSLFFRGILRAHTEVDKLVLMPPKHKKLYIDLME